MPHAKDTMTELFVGHARLMYHARQLRSAGHVIAAQELERETARLGEALTQIDGVISDFPEAAPNAQSVSA